LSALGDIAQRIIAELGPWLWMLLGFALMAFTAWRGSILSLGAALSAIAIGAWQIWLASQGQEQWPLWLVLILIALGGSAPLYALRRFTRSQLIATQTPTKD
jgi:membrane protein implicated in regulation of membrane protease activity